MNAVPFDAFTCPLDGVHLIEASAGTGKTYTLQVLAARFILERSVPIDQIILVTFTNAAAAELKVRIRSVLQNVLACLSSCGGCPPEEQSATLVSHFLANGDADREAAAERLRVAIASLDSAYISTIHSFCQRILQTFAFRTGNLFEFTIRKNLDSHLEDLARDFIRMQYYAIPFYLSSAEFNNKLIRRIVKLAKAPDVKPILDDPDAHDLPAELDELLRLPEDQFVPAVRERLRQTLTPVDLPRERLWILQYLGIGFVRSKLAEWKAREHVLGFDDILRQLQAAMTGPNADSLLGALQKQFRVGLIDEFQDTDPVQYEIFKRIFTRENRAIEQTSFFMVGDPKQAIYSFRNGDLNTYFRARDELIVDLPAQRHSLHVNYRSCGALVDGVNTLFGDNAFQTPHIRFEPATAAGSPPSSGDDGSSSPFRIHVHEIQKIPSVIASAELVNRLLASGIAIPRKSDSGEPQSSPIRPADIAILLCSAKKHALRLRAELLRRGIPAVCSKLGNVFDSPEAVDLADILNAVLNPTRHSLVLAALTGNLLGMDVRRLRSDDAYARAARESVFDLHHLWLNDSFRKMFDKLLVVFELKRRLLAQSGGERRVTNLLQLGELLRRHQRENNLSPVALIRFLEQQILSPDRDNEAYDQLLETDRDAVRIMTIHASKGLEFPICILPDLDDVREAKHPSKYDKFHLGGEQVFDLSESPASKSADNRESLQESLRLAYVAFTRAKFACHILRSDRTDPNLLSHLPNTAHPQFFVPSDFLRGSSDDPASRTFSFRDMRELVPWTDLHFSDVVFSNLRWRVASFSMLNPAEDFSVRKNRDDDTPDHDSESEEGATPASAAHDFRVQEHERCSGDDPVFRDALLRLPGSAALGSAWHKIFETLDFSMPSVVCARDNPFPKNVVPDSDYQSLTEGMLRHVLDCPLPPASFRLRDLARCDSAAELSFWFPVDRADPAALLSFIRDYAIRTFPSLDDSAFSLRETDHFFQSGFLNGIIDLVFRHDGKYYLLDWKSNRIGGRFDSFLAQNLPREMAARFYFLQYFLYIVGLFKHLRFKLPDFDFDAHFGGVYYVFLRGVRADSADSGIFFDRPPLHAVQQFMQILGANE